MPRTRRPVFEITVDPDYLHGLNMVVNWRRGRKEGWLLVQRDSGAVVDAFRLLRGAGRHEMDLAALPPELVKAARASVLDADLQARARAARTAFLVHRAGQEAWLRRHGRRIEAAERAERRVL
jgi:hypothetical protein